MVNLQLRFLNFYHNNLYNNIIFKVYHEFAGKKHSGPQYGGPYTELFKYYRKEVIKLKRKFKLEFYFDENKIKQFKSDTLYLYYISSNISSVYICSFIL